MRCESASLTGSYFCRVNLYLLEPHKSQAIQHDCMQFTTTAMGIICTSWFDSQSYDPWEVPSNKQSKSADVGIDLNVLGLTYSKYIDGIFVVVQSRWQLPLRVQLCKGRWLHMPESSAGYQCASCKVPCVLDISFDLCTSLQLSPYWGEILALNYRLS